MESEASGSAPPSTDELLRAARADADAVRADAAAARADAAAARAGQRAAEARAVSAEAAVAALSVQLRTNGLLFQAKARAAAILFLFLSVCACYTAACDARSPARAARRRLSR